MATPPTPKSVSGPLCKICNKPFRDHSFEQQQKCNRIAKKRDEKVGK